MDDKKYTFFLCDDCFKKIDFPLEEKTIGGGRGFCAVCVKDTDALKGDKNYFVVLTKPQMEKITGKKVVVEGDNLLK